MLLIFLNYIASLDVEMQADLLQTIQSSFFYWRLMVAINILFYFISFDYFFALKILTRHWRDSLLVFMQFFMQSNTGWLWSFLLSHWIRRKIWGMRKTCGSGGLDNVQWTSSKNYGNLYLDKGKINGKRQSIVVKFIPTSYSLRRG